LYDGLFLAGFECTSARLRDGRRLNLTRAVGHDLQLDDDHARVEALGIRGVREGLSWPEAASDPHCQFDWLRRVLDSAQRHAFSLILDLCHFGYPDDLDPLTPEFVDAFCSYAQAVARIVASESSVAIAFTPINEPSYFAWAAGEVGIFAPFLNGRGAELKRALVGAAIRAIDAIREICPNARIVNTDPLCRVVPGAAPGDEEIARRFNSEDVYEGWDMLAGRLLPELGGSPGHLDIIGINYYPWNQWELGAPFIDPLLRVRQPLAENDPRRWPVERLIADLADRFDAPLLISETSCVEPDRSQWIMKIADAARILIDEGKPLIGICIYPALSMPRWQEPQKWLHMGLWDVNPSNPAYERAPAVSAIAALRRARKSTGVC
jgi:beta-glucosidase/6-phospho-beta-glucosidase/beta-galactosidase